MKIKNIHKKKKKKFDLWKFHDILDEIVLCDTYIAIELSVYQNVLVLKLLVMT